MPGHSVLQLPVPALEEWVVARTRHYDDEFVSDDPLFAHAHITALGPFDPDPSTTVTDRLAELAASTAPIPIVLAELAQFPNGIIHLVPTPAEELRTLTDRLVDAFPGYLPYRGDFGPRVEPHLTLDAASDTVSLDSTLARLGDLLPVSCVLSTLQLAWWEAGACRVVAQWDLGVAGSPHG